MSRVNQLRSEAEFLEALIAHHNDNGGGRGRDDSGGQAFHEPPRPLFCHQLSEGQDDGVLALNLEKSTQWRITVCKVPTPSLSYLSLKVERIKTWESEGWTLLQQDSSAQ